MTEELKKRIAQINAGTAPAGYKKTKVGIVPEEWEEIPFGELVVEYRTKTKTENEDVLLSCAINGIFLNSELFSHQRGASNIGYLKIDYGTLILSAQNLHLGNANVNLRFESGIVSPAYKTYQIQNCDVRYFSFWIKREETKRFFYNATTTGASQCRRNIEWDSLYEQKVAFPPLPEQQKIAEILTAQDAVIALMQKQIELLQKQKKAFLQKMFPKKGSTVPEIRFKGFTDAWVQRKLSQIVADISTGKSVNSEDCAWNSESIGVLKTSCVSDDLFDATECKKVIPEECDLVKCPVEADTIIVSRMNTPDRVGACGYVSQDYPNLYLPDRLWKLRMNETTDTYLIYLLLTSDSYKARLKGIASGTSGSMHNIPKDAFLELNITLPATKTEQQLVSNVFDSLNNIIALHQRKLELEQQKKKALMQLLLTGKVRCIK